MNWSEKATNTIIDNNIKPPRFQPNDFIVKYIIKKNNGAQFNWLVIANQRASQSSLPKLFKKKSNSLSNWIRSHKLSIYS